MYCFLEVIFNFKNMKKCFYLFAAVAVMAVACKSVPEEQKVADFKAYIEQFMAEYNEKVSAIQADSTSTQEQKRAKFEEVYEATCEALVAECKDVIKKNPESGAAVLALQNIASMITPEEAEDDLSIVRVKNFYFAPMTREEAVMQMNLLEHNFFAFRDEDNGGSFAVVYRRNEGGYGLIDDAE